MGLNQMHRCLYTCRPCLLKHCGKIARNNCIQRNTSILSTARSEFHNQLSTQRYPTISLRGAKTRSTVKVKELPQGALPPGLPELVDEHDGPSYPTNLQQVRNNMAKFSHCVLLTKVGGFYELYFEHAEKYGPLLNLKVAKKKTNAGPVYMAGFPVFQLDRFLKILVQDLSKHVAISEEFTNDSSGKIKSGGLLFDRKVTRVVTPGTLIDEKFMDPHENSFLLSVHLGTPEVQDEYLPKAEKSANLSEVGLAWLDLSSGDFFTQKTNPVALPSIIGSIGPREILLDGVLRDTPDPRLELLLKEEHHVITYHGPAQKTGTVSDWSSMLEDTAIELDPSKFSSVEVAAGNFLLSYVSTNLQGAKAKLQAPVPQQAENFMMIDRNSLRALEVRSTLRDGTFDGSLLHAVRKTVTKSGARLLSQRLCSPSMSLMEINDRLDVVTELLNNPMLRQDLIALLKRTFDSLRLVQKFSFGRGDADDLLSLSRTVQLTSEISELLSDHVSTVIGTPESEELSEDASRARTSLQKLLGRLSLQEPAKLSERILATIDEDMLSEQHRLEDSEVAAMVELAEEVLNEEGAGETLKGAPRGRKSKAATAPSAPKEAGEVWIMRTNASTTLKRLHDHLDTLTDEKAALNEKLRVQRNASSLTLRWTPGLGHICHVKGKDMGSFSGMSTARSVSSSKSTRSFHLPEWTHLGTRIDEAKVRIRAEEQRVFNDLRAQVVRNLVKIRRNASVLDELDVACSFATLAQEQSLTRPILHAKSFQRVIGGRHPMVEVGLVEQGRRFTSNDCSIGGDERILLITGPNMAGKSTFLRQNALISILAQTGSFVPAEYAEIGLVDKIFTRVGSADSLHQDQSTFMVEMLETADILNQATSRSFVIMDEVGRGTTPEDGIAVGFACLHHLYHVNQCRSLFATHFHALADMTKGFEKLACYCTDVAEESDGSFSYVHRLKKGVNRQSHALKVARLAGLPQEAIAVAEQVLKSFKALPEPPMQEEPLQIASSAT